MPKHNPMDDACRHAIYLDKNIVRFFRNFKAGAPMNEEPAFPRMIDAGLYDGLGTLLPLGVYWWERVMGQSYTMYSIGLAFDFFPAWRLLAPDAEMKAYMNLMQMDRYPDTQKAWRDYLHDRADPKYKSAYPSAVLPDYMITADGEIVPDKDYSVPFDPRPFQPRFGGGVQHVDDLNDPVLAHLATPGGADEFAILNDAAAAEEDRRSGLDILDRLEAEDESNEVRYWYHPESDSLFTTQPGEDRPGDPLVEQLTEEEYASVRDRMSEKTTADDLAFDDPPDFDIL